MDSFYMTLPSNSSMDVHPDNTLTDYKVRLPQPLSFKENGKSVWWKLHTLTDGITSLKIQNFSTSFPGDVDWRRKDILPGILWKTLGSSSCYERWRFKDYIHFNYSKRSEKVKITLKEGSMLSIKDPICAMLGFAIPKKQKVTEQRQFESGEYPAEFVADVRPIQHLFVYTDIIEDHIVGDTSPPYTYSKGVWGIWRGRHAEFENPHYIPLKQKFIDTYKLLSEMIQGRKKIHPRKSHSETSFQTEAIRFLSLVLYK